jgi:hypothetical protein
MMDDLDFWEKVWASFMSTPVAILAIVVILFFLAWSVREKRRSRASRRKR